MKIDVLLHCKILLTGVGIIFSLKFLWLFMSWRLHRIFRLSFLFLRIRLGKFSKIIFFLIIHSPSGFLRNPLVKRIQIALISVRFRVFFRLLKISIVKLPFTEIIHRLRDLIEGVFGESESFRPKRL